MSGSGESNGKTGSSQEQNHSKDEQNCNDMRDDSGENTQ
jgi:hypothetical protein